MKGFQVMGLTKLFVWLIIELVGFHWVIFL